jgi:hypothetical protein
MNSLPMRVAAGCVRGWTWLYTWRLPSALRQARRAEIESDLWEFQHDPDTSRGPNEGLWIIGRLLLGMPDDVVWRFECAVDGDDPIMRRTIAMAAVATVFIAALWTFPAWLGRDESPRRTPVTQCADETTTFQRTPDLRIRVMECAGAFFTPRSRSASP